MRRRCCCRTMCALGRFSSTAVSPRSSCGSGEDARAAMALRMIGSAPAEQPTLTDTRNQQGNRFRTTNGGMRKYSSLESSRHRTKLTSSRLTTSLRLAGREATSFRLPSSTTIRLATPTRVAEAEAANVVALLRLESRAPGCLPVRHLQAISMRK